MLYGLEQYLQMSEVEKVQEFQASLRKRMKGRPTMLPSEKVAWYRSEIAEWGSTQKEKDSAECDRLREDCKHPWAQAKIANNSAIRQNFTWDEVQRYWMFDSSRSLQQMRATTKRLLENPCDDP